MKRICEICSKEFETKSSTRIYCYYCSGEQQEQSIKQENIKRLF